MIDRCPSTIDDGRARCVLPRGHPGDHVATTYATTFGPSECSTIWRDRDADEASDA